MAAIIKTAEEIEKMRVAGRLAAEVLTMIGDYVKKGVTTDELNTICHDYIVNQQQAIPAPLNYGHPPFPKSICTSVNHVICHGIPADKKLKDGDIVNIDVTVIKDGYHGDTSKMFVVCDTLKSTASVLFMRPELANEYRNLPSVTFDTLSYVGSLCFEQFIEGMPFEEAFPTSLQDPS